MQELFDPGELNLCKSLEYIRYFFDIVVSVSSVSQYSKFVFLFLAISEVKNVKTSITIVAKNNWNLFVNFVLM